MERLPPEVFDNIGSFCDFALDEIKIWPAGRPRRNVSSVNKLFAANFYDSMLKQKLACMEMKSAPIWRMLVNNMTALECILEELYEAHGDSESHWNAHKEWGFWLQQVYNFEHWWLNNPNSRAEVIVYKPPPRIGVAL